MARRTVSLSPANWEPEELEEYWRLQRKADREVMVSRSDRPMVAGTRNPLAVRAGLKALQQGGTAADAVLTTSLAQIALALGAGISYAGLFTLLYYEAASKKVHALSAGFKTFAGEKDPRSIPPYAASGRGALVGGFMAGVQATHDRFGKLPFSVLFEPALLIAQGFDLPESFALDLEARPGAPGGDVLSRTPEGREIFLPNGQLPVPGEKFSQPALAGTLEAVAQLGASYMYTGRWAERFVDIVRREGGAASLEDLASYQPIWCEPMRASFYSHEVATAGPPDFGGAMLIEGLNLISESGLDGSGHASTSPESLYWLIQISRQGHHLASLPSEARVTAEHARLLWERMRQAGGVVGPNDLPVRPSPCSASAVAVDEAGNVAALTHSSNTSPWGRTGMFVDGVSIPDPGCYQQEMLMRTGPGAHHPNPTHPTIVTRDGLPVLASSSIGRGLHEVSLQHLFNILALGMDLEASITAPTFHAPLSLPEYTWLVDDLRQTAVEGEFSPELLARVEEMGQGVVTYPPVDREAPLGFWTAISVEETGLVGAQSVGSGGGVEPG